MQFLFVNNENVRETPLFMRPYCEGQFVAGMDVNKCPTARRVRYLVRASDGGAL